MAIHLTLNVHRSIMGVPAAIYRGNCSGHGVAISGHIHGWYGCGTTCLTASTKPVATKNSVCLWPPTVLAPAGPYLRTVLINGIMPILDKDVLTVHRSSSTNIIMVGPCGKTPPRPKTCNCSMLTTEDSKGIGHTRIMHAKTKTVYAQSLAMGKVGDQLGPPCLSVISQGSPNVMIGP